MWVSEPYLFSDDSGHENTQTYLVKVVNLILHQILITNLQGNE